MSKTVYKYGPLAARREQLIFMPSDAELLCVQLQHGEPFVWALVDPGKPQAARRLALLGTGHPMPEEKLSYVGTFQLAGGDFIVHLFDGGW